MEHYSFSLLAGLVFSLSCVMLSCVSLGRALSRFGYMVDE